MTSKYKYLKHLARRSASYIHPAGYAATLLMIQELDIQPGQNILELGCGTGATLAEIAHAYDVNITGVDALDEMTDAARKRIEYFGLSGRVKILKTEPAEPFPFDDNSFDRLYAESVIGFQKKEDVELVLTDVRRVLKLGGFFVINESLWKETMRDEMVTELFESANADFGLAQASPSNITLQVLADMADRAGLRLVKKINLDGLRAEPKAVSGLLLSSKYDSRSKRRILFSPRILIEEFNYRRKIRNHRGEGRYIESWLLKFEKV